MAKRKDVARKRHDPWPLHWLVINRNDGRIIVWNGQVAMFPSRRFAREFCWHNINLKFSEIAVVRVEITPPKPKRKKGKS